MASGCGGCVALMEGAVPMMAHVAGIVMCLIKDGNRFAVLTEILGDEDHLGYIFSSRGRHTRCSRDWSSDVCSSDLRTGPEGGRCDSIPDACVQESGIRERTGMASDLRAVRTRRDRSAVQGDRKPSHAAIQSSRSEERRVGKACRECWRSGYSHITVT